jgi:hypothetical protein
MNVMMIFIEKTRIINPAKAEDYTGNTFSLKMAE